jgi:diadenosine tetraphosphate (Ap4A) HIT family hydrolase
MHRFKAIIDAPQAASEPWNRAIFETKSFVVFPSLGALVAGWMLIVPRRPMLNLRSITTLEREELCVLVSELANKLSLFPGEIFAFEHGNTIAGGLVGCGVDQAHLHLVPLEFDLMNAASKATHGDIQWTNLEGVDTFHKCMPDDGEYIGIWRPSKLTGLAGVMRRPQSQWVRKVIADKLGEEATWDYNLYPNLANLEKTCNLLNKTKDMRNTVLLNS